MALSTIGRNQLNTGIDDNSDATAITIDSSERVGIGATNMDEMLLIQQTASGANTDVTIRSANDGNSRINFGDQSSDGSGRVDYDHTSNYMAITTNSSEQMRIDSSGNIGIGTSSIASGGSNTTNFNVHTPAATSVYLKLSNSSTGNSASDGLDLSQDSSGNAYFINRENGFMTFWTNATERMRIDSSGTLLVGTTTTGVNSSSSEAGCSIQSSGILAVARSGGDVASFNRQTNDGTVVQIHQAGTVEGTISVSGSTVSYNGGHLSRWSQAADGNRIDGLVKGTVMTNLDQMAEWTKDGVTEDNEQLNCMAVSSVEGDANVAGVFVNWDDDDKDYTADMNVAMTGDMVIRIAKDTTVARGDLLMSAGDGTAKPQDDDIVRSKTIAKVTSTTKSHTYDDGSYLVPCVLMAC